MLWQIKKFRVMSRIGSIDLIIVKLWVKHGQKMGRTMSNHGSKGVESWSTKIPSYESNRVDRFDHCQVRGQTWSKNGSNDVESWVEKSRVMVKQGQMMGQMGSKEII